MFFNSKGASRYLTLSKKDGKLTAQAMPAFNLVRNSRHQMHGLLQRFSLTNKERQDLQPRTERSQYNEGLKHSWYSGLIFLMLNLHFYGKHSLGADKWTHIAGKGAVLIWTD